MKTRDSPAVHFKSVDVYSDMPSLIELVHSTPPPVAPTNPAPSIASDRRSIWNIVRSLDVDQITLLNTRSRQGTHQAQVQHAI
jgi:hypothetical protein